MKKFKLTTTQTALLLVILTFGSKLIGFVREMVLANYFGAGMVTDAYVMGQSIPNTLLAAVIGAVGTAYMPLLAQKFENGGIESANKFTSKLLNAIFSIIAIVCVIGYIFSSQIVSFFAPGYDAEKIVLTVFYMRVAFVGLFFTSGLTILEAYLQYRGVFTTQTVIGYLQSISVIIFIILAAKIDYHLLVFGVVVGYMLRCICDYFVVRNQGFIYSADFKYKSVIKDVMSLALPVFIGGSIGEINSFVDKMLGSGLPEGSVSSLNYSGTMISFIMTFTTTIMMTLIYPKLNKAFATDDMESISSLAERGINLLALVTIPFAMGAFLYSNEVIHIVYERGAFDAAATGMAAIAFKYYAIKIPFDAVDNLVIKVFYSMHDMKTPVKCSIVALVVNCTLNIILVRIIGIAGLAIATSIASIVGMSLRYFTFKRKYPDIRLLRSKRKLAKVVIFSIVAVGFSFLVYTGLGMLGIRIIVVKLGLAVIASVLAYLGMLYLAKFEELGLIKDLVKRG